ncbi:MAG: hypothetical protein JWO87_985 [Phycisphaerales bacterium]|jgi:hypothetical protein|nr:hypothetical protein [Phycisphaerales bacterium]MDB5299322.1 hypothetical protein [Phycisphaerales bacterium]MDB5304423.1 hypothetical protein [Phycisphaerales bacterium]
MALTCNIDAKGKFVRLIYGIILVAAGASLIYFWALHSGSTLRWTVSLLCLLGGAFAVFEARAGWCVVRAMGMKTPM